MKKVAFDDFHGVYQGEDNDKDVRTGQKQIRGPSDRSNNGKSEIIEERIKFISSIREREEDDSSKLREEQKYKDKIERFVTIKSLIRFTNNTKYKLKLIHLLHVMKRMIYIQKLERYRFDRCRLVLN